MKDTDKNIVAIIAIASEMGATYKIVSTSVKIAGKIKIKGVKQTTSRIKDATTALIGLPAA
jgi:hypothetical protein